MPSILMPAASKAGGKCLATVPNVGFIPAPPPVQQLPMPFPSTAECAAADKTGLQLLPILRYGLLPPAIADRPGGATLDRLSAAALPPIARAFQTVVLERPA